MEPLVLAGRHVRLEPLDECHIDALVKASANDEGLYRWSFVPVGKERVTRYVKAAIAARETGSAVPFATVRVEDGLVIGSTRFFNWEQWDWPEGPRRPVDACEIGYTWLTRAAIRTAANTETKLLMLAHAFEVWNVLRVCLHTDARNARSRAAMERLGVRFEGILRAHRMAVDYTPRDSARYSILPAEWPEVKQRLQLALDK